MQGSMPTIGTPPRCRWDEVDPQTGKKWSDMPGLDEIFKKCNFFLFVRGLNDPWKMSGKHRKFNPKGPNASKRNRAFDGDSMDDLFNHDSSRRNGTKGTKNLSNN